MSKSYQEQDFEKYIESRLTANEYDSLPTEAFDRERGIFPDVVVSFVQDTQPEQWAKLEAAYKDNARQRFLQDLTAALESRGTLYLLRHGLRTTGTTIKLAAFQPNTGKNPEVQRRYEENRLGITTQFYYSPTDTGQSIDLALSVNGLPVATAELKNPWTDQTVEDAKKQYKSSRDPGDPVLKFKRGALVHFAVDTNNVAYTTELDGDDTHFLPFNKGHENGAGNPPREGEHRTAYLWEEVWAKDSWMEILQRFMHIDTEEIYQDGVKVGEEETMIFPRYHQLECVRQLVSSARENGAGEDYLIQHSTGSGKSKSIAWLVHRLVSLHDENDEAVFDGVIVVTDRTVLDEQLRDTIYELDHKTGVVHAIKGENQSKSAELAEALDAGKPVIITTLQTFPHVIEHTQNLPERDYSVVVDEAHSSQSGEMAHEMKQILSGIDLDEDADAEDALVEAAETRGKQENLSFFAFTATPKAKTLETFGTVPENGEDPEPFHLYSMRQAIEEEFILDVLEHYTTYDTFYNIAKVIEEDPQVPEKRAKKAVARFLKLHPHNISQKVEIIVEHFRNHTQHRIGGKAKAMIVTSSRIHAVRYKKAIDEYVENNNYDLGTLVAFSGTVEDDGAEYTEQGMNDGIKESELPNVFDTPEYRVLVVADKYQTGFDQPLLHTMYIDKKLSGIQAVQTLSRLNRTHPGKEDTFVLDFENDREDIHDAFEPFYEKTTLDEKSDPQHIYQLEAELDSLRIYTQQEVDQFAEAFFDPENNATEETHAKLSSYVQPARDRFMAASEETKEEFRSKLRSFIRLYKFQSQVVNYADTDLEKLYTFGRFLYKELPKASGHSEVEFDDELALQYYRLEKNSEDSIDLNGKGGGVSSPTETGTGSQSDDEVELSRIVDRINEELGTDFTEADQLFLDQLKEDALDDEHLRRSAQVNSRENFALEFDQALTEMFIDRMDQNKELFAEFIDNDEVQDAITRHLRQEVYEESQPAES